ncbi:MAG: hypothetical protein WC364_10230 [Eubacteriales bacterium]
MIIHISGGLITAMYDERLNLHSLGKTVIQRASHVEPDINGMWSADMQPVGGPVLGPFTKRSEALKAECDWIDAHLSTLGV